MGNDLIQRNPQQLKIKRIVLMRIAFLSMLIGSGISIITSIASSLYALSSYVGDPVLDFITQIILLNDSLILVSTALSITGSILLLLSLAKIGEKGSNKLKWNSKIAFILLIVAFILNFAFSYILSNLVVWGILDGNIIDTLLSITPLLTIAADSVFYIFLGFTLRQLKDEHSIESKPLITTFIYPIMLALRALLLFELFSSTMGEILASLIVSIMGLVILIIFFSRALVGLKRVKNKIVTIPKSQTLPTRKEGKFCANCGAPIESIASFCANCGHPIE